DLWSDRARDFGRNFILQIKYLFQGAVESVDPEVCAGRRINELSCDADLAGRSAYAALQDIAHAQLASDLLHVYRPALVGEARVASDHEQPAHARQRHDDLFHHAVGEI